MTVQASDISIVFSGGQSNINANMSLGGDPSSNPIFGTNNNLFPNVSASDALNGIIDYRCIYVFNDNNTYSLTNTSIFIDSLNSNNINIGIVFAQDIQTITINGNVTSGSFMIKYNLSMITSNYNSDINIWANNLQTSLSAVSVIATQTTDVIVFTINLGTNTYYPALELVSNSLVGSTSILITKLNNGSPINSIASFIQNSTSSPPNVSFVSATTQISAINIGTLGPGDGFPIWFQRTIMPNTETIVNDGFNLRILGDF